MSRIALDSALLFLIVAGRYFMFAGFFHWLIRRPAFSHLKIVPAPHSKARMISEIKWSLVTSVIFAISGALLYGFLGHTKFYWKVEDYGWGYFIFSLVILMFLHDMYFYWVHRLMHLKLFYRRLHKVHHDSKDPSPWAAFSFHPLEGLLEALIIPVLAFAIPIHPAIFLTFLMVMTVGSVANHIGYELFPRWFVEVPLLREWITATHHHAHHSELKHNFGLYFMWWDRWMGTQDPDYEKRFKAIATRQRSMPNVAAPVPAP